MGGIPMYILSIHATCISIRKRIYTWYNLHPWLLEITLSHDVSERQIFLEHWEFVIVLAKHFLAPLNKICRHNVMFFL